VGVPLFAQGIKEGRIGDFLFLISKRRDVMSAKRFFFSESGQRWVQAVRHRDRDNATDRASKDRED
jgi:hypothetical protein